MKELSCEMTSRTQIRSLERTRRQMMMSRQMKWKPWSASEMMSVTTLRTNLVTMMMQMQLRSVHLALTKVHSRSSIFYHSRIHLLGRRGVVQ